MAPSILSRASAALLAAVFAARTGRLGTDPDSDNEHERSGGKNGNIVLSPYSILLVLAVVMRGARGPTLTEMERLLPSHVLPALLRLTTSSIPPSSGEEAEFIGVGEGTTAELSVFTRMYLDRHLAENTYFQRFRDRLLRECRSGNDSNQQLPVQLIDCTKANATADTINRHIGSATRGHITNMVSPSLITPQTRLLVLSAAFFKGAWMNPFFDQDTEKAPFYALHYSLDNRAAEQEAYDGNEGYRGLVKQYVDTMHVTLEPRELFYLRVDSRVKAVGLPYVDKRFVMYVVQPRDAKNLESVMRFQDKESSSDGFPTFENVVRLMREGREKMEGVEARVSLPKFALKASDNFLDLIPVFQRELGIQAPFDGRVADFSGISGDRSLLMSAFVHQAEIEVDEKGTVASAATLAGIALMSAMPRRRVDVTIDGPFAFQIWYHGSDETVAHEGGTASGTGAPAAYDPMLGDYVLFSGCVTDALAAQQ